MQRPLTDKRRPGWRRGGGKTHLAKLSQVWVEDQGRRLASIRVAGRYRQGRGLAHINYLLSARFTPGRTGCSHVLIGRRPPECSSWMLSGSRNVSMHSGVGQLLDAGMGDPQLFQAFSPLL